MTSGQVLCSSLGHPSWLLSGCPRTRHMCAFQAGEEPGVFKSSHRSYNARGEKHCLHHYPSSMAGHIDALHRAGVLQGIGRRLG